MQNRQPFGTANIVNISNEDWEAMLIQMNRSDVCNWSDIGTQHRDPENQIDQAMDNLLTGLTTLRDEFGVVDPRIAAELDEWQRQLLLDNGYTRDELYPSNDPDLFDISQRVNSTIVYDGSAILALTAAEWRVFVRSHPIELRSIIEAIMISWISGGFPDLPPYIQHVLGVHSILTYAVGLQTVMRLRDRMQTRPES